jgi:hypothetical protein
MNIGFLYIAVAFTLVISACNKEHSAGSDFVPVTMSIVNKTNGVHLLLNSPGVNPHGEPLTITRFAYYISHIKLINSTGGVVALTPEYYLVDEANPASQQLQLKVPEGKYRAVEFLLGVDSIRNVSGIQSGALDPANGMFWSWNTGYIFAKLEGKSVVSPAPLSNVTFHIGGFKTGESALQNILLNFPVPLEVKSNTDGHIFLSAETNAWFNAVHEIKIADSAFCMTPGVFAQQIAQNYARMFSVDSVTNH